MDRGAWQATYSPWGRKESDTTEWLTLTSNGDYVFVLIYFSFLREVNGRTGLPESQAQLLCPLGWVTLGKSLKLCSVPPAHHLWGKKKCKQHWLCRVLSGLKGSVVWSTQDRTWHTHRTAKEQPLLSFLQLLLVWMSKITQQGMAIFM